MNIEQKLDEALGTKDRCKVEYYIVAVTTYKAITGIERTVDIYDSVEKLIGVMMGMQETELDNNSDILSDSDEFGDRPTNLVHFDINIRINGSDFLDIDFYVPRGSRRAIIGSLSTGAVYEREELPFGPVSHELRKEMTDWSDITIGELYDKFRKLDAFLRAKSWT